MAPGVERVGFRRVMGTLLWQGCLSAALQPHTGLSDSCGKAVLGHPSYSFLRPILANNASSSWRLWGELLELFGFIFDPAKDVKPGFVGPYLGAIEDYSRISDLGVIEITPKPQFVDNVKKLIKIALTNVNMPPNDRKKIGGKTGPSGFNVARSCRQGTNICSHRCMARWWPCGIAPAGDQQPSVT